MTNRSVVKVIIFSLITCGIYAIYWTYVSTEELNRQERENPLTNYIISILLSFVTCGIYGIYWWFKFFKKVDTVTGEENFLVNFILMIFGLSIVSMAIAQNSFNNSSNK